MKAGRLQGLRAGAEGPAVMSDDRDLHVVDRRQRIEETLELLAAVSPDPELARGRSDIECGCLELVDVHPVPLHREVGLLFREASREPAPGVPAVLAAPDGWRAARAGARRRLERHDINGVGVLGVNENRKAEV